MGRKKKVDGKSPRVTLVRPEVYARIESRGTHGGDVRLFADGRVEVATGFDSSVGAWNGGRVQPVVTVEDLRDALALLSVSLLVRQ